MGRGNYLPLPPSPAHTQNIIFTPTTKERKQIQFCWA